MGLDTCLHSALRDLVIVSPVDGRYTEEGWASCADE
ncbi:MAG: hypothetical protein JWO42_3355, partial [Chloroflexi bacterium]|nr:hypothetical protein [Chloroflexota bacterium]